MSFAMAARFLTNIKDFATSLFDLPLADAVIFGIHIDGHLLLETMLVVVIVFLLFQKSYTPDTPSLSEAEIDQLCEEWTPEPLHPPITEEMMKEPPVIESAAGPHTVVDGKDVINMASADFLGLIGHPKITESCDAAIQKYGVGACGPRGFYGTIDVHMDLEEKIAKFMGTPDSILYSYGLATVMSVIPAFCKAGDLILADEGVNWGIQNGLYLSRSKVKMFKHNDMKDLESLLEEVRKEDLRKKKALNRRFIVVEAIYQNSGKLAPLDEILRFKEKYKFRILVDESNSIGVLGATGRGLTEHFNIPVEKIDIITAAMGHSLSSVGGFCTGSAKVVDHQRLAGAGYCFSAALPPYLASASISSIEILEDNPQLLSQLHQNVTTFRSQLATIPGVKVEGNPLSPLVFLQLSKSTSFTEDSAILQRITKMMLENGVLMCEIKRSILDKCNMPAAIRICVTAGHTEEDLVQASSALRKVVEEVLLS